MNIDLINILREYFTYFGVEDEGPSDEISVFDILPINENIESDLSILNKILRDDVTKKQFTICNNLIDDLANKLSEKAFFIEELKQIKDKINFDIEGTSNGIVWFQQALETDPRKTKLLKEIEIDGVDPLLINTLKIQGSLILRLYISLVYMRSGPVYEILRVGSKNKCKIMNTSYKLFNSDYIRHLRNSLSHGTFRTNIAGVYFKDNNYEIVSTPGFLDKLCMWIFVLYYQCVLFIESDID